MEKKKEMFHSLILLVSPKVVLPAPVVRVFPGERLSCSALGVPPINIVMTRNSTTVANSTNATVIQVDEKSDEGKYQCRATSKHGIDEREFVVILEGEVTQTASFYNG